MKEDAAKSMAAWVGPVWVGGTAPAPPDDVPDNGELCEYFVP